MLKRALVLTFLLVVAALCWGEDGELRFGRRCGPGPIRRFLAARRCCGTVNTCCGQTPSCSTGTSNKPGDGDVDANTPQPPTTEKPPTLSELPPEVAPLIVPDALKSALEKRLAELSQPTTTDTSTNTDTSTK